MILNIYADPIQGITFTVVGDTSAYAVPTTYDEYMDELIAISTAYGNKFEQINVAGNKAYASKITNEILQEYPNTPVNYVWEEKE